jgi:hypothetical protein
MEHGNPCSAHNCPNPKSYSSRTLEIKKRKYKKCHGWVTC